MECTQASDPARELKASQPQLERADGIRPHPTTTIAQVPSVVVRALGVPIVALTLHKRLQRDDGQARLPLRHPLHLHAAADADTSEPMSVAQAVSRMLVTEFKEGNIPPRRKNKTKRPNGP